MKQTHVLFICTGNAGRSQIAEALFRQLAGERARVASAGVEPWPHLHPVALRLMQARGLDMAGHHPKPVDTLINEAWDFVVTLGDKARDLTPELAGNPCRIHWPVADPADADAAGPAAQETAFRSAIAEIGRRLPDLLELVTTHPTARQLHLAPGFSTLGVTPDYAHPAFDPVRQVPLIAAAGFRCLELNCYFGSTHFAWDLTDSLRQLKELLFEHQLPVVSIHAVRDDVTVPDAGERRFMIDVTKANADAAAMLGATTIVFHGGLPVGVERARGEAILYETIKELADHVLTMPCRFGWENDATGLTAEEHLAWIRKFNPGAIGLVLDVGHAHISRNLATYLELAGPRLASLHLHDNHGSEDDHWLPGLGTIAWDQVMAGLAKAGYTGPLMLEARSDPNRYDFPAFVKEAMAAWQRMRRAT